jgi:metallophosphoesterase (TIGR03768 family)
MMIIPNSKLQEQGSSFADHPIAGIVKGVQMNVLRRVFLKFCAGCAAALGLELSAPGTLEKVLAAGGSPPAPSCPIAFDVFTTLRRAVMPDPPSGSEKILPNEVSKYKQNGYGNWHYASGIDCVKRLDIVPATYNSASAANSARLLSFFTITDIHITDKESPTQAIYLGLKDGVSSAYSAVMLYTTHVLDAAVQTINAIHKQNPIDFGISLGDTCNNTQYNELRWYVDVLDGKVITPSSGAHAGAGAIDYQKPYKAAGLDKTIPWYQALGNHDHFWMGTNPVSDYLRQAYIGEDILKMGDILTDPDGINKRDFYMGVLDCRTPYGDIIGAGPVGSTNAPKIASDPDRRSLSIKQWMSEFFATSSTPAGHGFNQSNLDNGFASYSFEPRSNIPIKVIVLDDTQREDDVDFHGYGHGSLDNARYDWLVSELDKGQAEGKLMIIAAHVPIGVEKPESFLGWWSKSSVSEKTLFDTLHRYPNLILWIAGHRHLNAVTAFKSPDEARPELGFWQIETSSLRDFPQQFRIFDIVRNSDNTVSIFTTDVDPAVKDGSLAAVSRSYGIAAHQLYSKTLSSSPELSGPATGSYNAELVIQLSPEMQTKIQNCGTPIRT